MTRGKRKAGELQIVVCVKPVPNPQRWDKLRLDPETMLLNRSQVPAVINPLDLHAIEQAVVLKESAGAAITFITMAPPEAEDQLREALAIGGDRAILLTDRAFAGADSLATARCLVAGIRKAGEFDLILCGGYSLDGSTAQVGPQIAELLSIVDLTHVVRLEFDAGLLRVECKLRNGSALYEAELPALVTFDREANHPRLPAMTGIRRARELSIIRWSAGEIGLPPEQLGLKGSPTQMLNIYTATSGRRGEMIAGTPGEQAAQLLARLRWEKTLGREA